MKFKINGELLTCFFDQVCYFYFEVTDMISGHKLFVDPHELNGYQWPVYQLLCFEFLRLLKMPRPNGDWECLPAVLDEVLLQTRQNVDPIRLSKTEWDHLQTRFAEEVYASFNATPPSTEDLSQTKDSLLLVRCVHCDRRHPIVAVLR